MLYESSHTPCVPNYYCFSFYLTTSPSSEWTKRWSWSEGVYMVGWMQQQIFLALFLLHCINLFWYYLIIRILVRLVIFSYTCLSLTSILGPYAERMLMTIDQMTKTKMKTTMINKTKNSLNNLECRGHRYIPTCIRLVSSKKFFGC